MVIYHQITHELSSEFNVLHLTNEPSSSNKNVSILFNIHVLFDQCWFLFSGKYNYK